MFEHLLELPAAWTCASGSFGVHLFEGELTVSEIDRLEAIGIEWRRRNTGKRVELVIVLPSNARMSHEERSRMAELIRRSEKERIASATVILAEGLRGAVHRSVLTGLMMIAPPPHPVKVCGAIADAMTYLFPYLRMLPGPSLAMSETSRAVQALYEAFRRR
jgi:hypothetical protein